jgi:hypothetical protein
MILNVKRFEFGTNYTIGRLYVDGVYECYTLEDKVREAGVKVPNETAIPVGTYKVIIDHSVHFGKDLPHILNVMGFDGVRIHSGNTDKDTEGCILLGDTWPGGDFIGNSRQAFDKFFAKLTQVPFATLTIE